MNSTGKLILSFCLGCAAIYLTGTQIAAHAGTQKDRARIVLSKEMPILDGAHLKATLVEVNYGPGEASTPHSHPCAVIGYVMEGTLRTQVKGEPEMAYSAGQSFYEAPNGVHLVSANASPTKPTKLLAYLLCDHEAPLSIDVTQHDLKEPTDAPGSNDSKGSSK